MATITDRKKKLLGPRGGQEDYVNIQIPRDVHGKINLFKARHNCASIGEALRVKFTDEPAPDHAKDQA